jgi:hypothetical protein
MSKDSTITSGLGLDEEYFDSLLETVHKNWSSSETLSDLMIVSASDIKFEEFEVRDSKLSAYEKKLVLLGMVIGLEKISREVRSKQMGAYKALFNDIFNSDNDEETI